MMEINDLLKLQYWGNSLRDYGQALLLLLLFWLLLFFFKKVILRSLTRIAKKTAGPADDFIVSQLSSFGFFFYLTLSVFFASRSLELSQRVDLWILYAVLTVVTYRLVLIVQAIVRFAFERATRVAGEETRAEMSSLRTFNWLINGAIWLIATLFILSNFGINITSFIAGLGVGGIAIALAAQTILGDFFSSLTIMLDKPFRVGDVISVGDVNGVVENIGVKTSRIRSVTGEQIVISNSDLTSSRIRNMKRMQERRVAYRIGIRYETPPDKARLVPELVRDIAAKHSEVRFDRTHFAAFGDFALIYEIVYFILSPDYSIFMNSQEQINFEIMDAFAQQDIRFAYPTQTVRLEREDGEQKIEA